MSLALLLALVQDLTRLLDVAGRGDPAALAVSTDESVLFSADGAAVRELSVEALVAGEAALLRETLVDAATVALWPTEERLFVAGGSQGLLAVDLQGPERPVTTVEDRGDLVCTDVRVVGEHAFALFAARDASRLVLYDRRSLECSDECPLGPGTAWALAPGDDAVFVAMGPGGLVRVGRQGGELRVAPGPRGARCFPPPEGLELEAGVVRDVAVGDGWLFAAADAGLVSVDLDQAWGPDMTVTVRPLRFSGKPSYARRVALRSGVLAVGTNAGPSELLDGAPYSAFGRMGRGLRLGDVDPASFVQGDEQHLLLFRAGDGELELLAHETPGGGWRGLTLGARHVYEQHIRAGLVVRERGPDGLTIASRSHPSGFPSAHAVFSACRPGRLLFGMDSAGAKLEGLLQVTDGGLAPVALIGEPPGYLPGEPWPAAESGEEWLVDGDGFALRLRHLSHAEDVHARAWPIPLPEPPEGGPGHTYFHAVRSGDLLLASRCRSRFGLVGYSVPELVAAARATPPGDSLDVAARFQVATHPTGEERSPVGSERAMKLALTTLADGRHIAGLAAGFDTQEDRALVLLYDVSAGASAEPLPLGAARGDRAGGNVIAVAFARRGARTFAVAADAGFGVRCFDVSEPSEPVPAATWEVGPNAFDGARDTPLDMVIHGDRAYVACARLGLVCLDVSDPSQDSLPVVAVRDTPGLAYGVALGEIDGKPVLAVCDHQAGVRLYGAEPGGS